jgi:hypothetical protein
LLPRLIPESGEVRRDHDASDDLGVGGLERVDLSREVSLPDFDVERGATLRNALPTASRDSPCLTDGP